MYEYNWCSLFYTLNANPEIQSADWNAAGKSSTAFSFPRPTVRPDINDIAPTLYTGSPRH